MQRTKSSSTQREMNTTLIYFQFLTLLLILHATSAYKFSTFLDRFSKKIPSLNDIPIIMKGIKGGHSTASQPSKTGIALPEKDNRIQKSNNLPLNLLFSDVDGTLVHYPKEIIQIKGIIHLPPSSTGMQGIISSKTLKLCRNLRKNQNTKLILVSGMRTSTLLKRIPFLPKADAYASEAGGRIFYPLYELKEYQGTIIEPVPYDDATEEDLSPFGLVEDLHWREEMSKESAAGSDGYQGDAFDIFVNLVNREDCQVKDVVDRDSSLWEFAKALQEEGFTLDTKGYSCCFRVNIKQQTSEISEEQFSSLSKRDVSEFGLATSVNLGCIDFYPKMSGKKNWCV